MGLGFRDLGVYGKPLIGTLNVNEHSGRGLNGQGHAWVLESNLRALGWNP